MAAGIAFLLSLDLKHEWLSTGQRASREGVRTKLHSLLFVFSLCTLGANLNSSSAPFLGYGAAIIHIHNAMIAYNAWSKEIINEGKLLISTTQETLQSMVASFFRQPKKSSSMGLLSSVTYSAVAMVSFWRGLKVLTQSLIPHYRSCAQMGSVRLK